MMILIGIIVRGSAFTFMHYDPDQKKYRNTYYILFSLSSLWTALWLGITVGALNYGLMKGSNNNYWSLYIAPWLNLYCFCVGIFTVFIFSFLASVFLIGETNDKYLLETFSFKAKINFILAIICGFCVFYTSTQSLFPIVYRFFESKLSVLSISIATFLIPIMLKSLSKKWVWICRVTASVIVLCILGGWAAADFPYVIYCHDTNHISFFASQSENSILKYLLFVLILGASVLFPSLFFLMYTFKFHKKSNTFEPLN